MLTLTRPKTTFDFQLEGEDTIYHLPYPKDLPASYTERLADLEGSDWRDALDFIRDVFTEHAPGAWDKLSMEQIGEVFAAWSVGLGE